MAHKKKITIFYTFCDQKGDFFTDLSANFSYNFFRAQNGMKMNGKMNVTLYLVNDLWTIVQRQLKNENEN